MATYIDKERVVKELRKMANEIEAENYITKGLEIDSWDYGSELTLCVDVSVLNTNDS